MPVARHVRRLGRIESAAADERDVRRAHRARLDGHPQRHPPGVPGRRGLWRVEVAVRVDPDDGEAAGARRETADRAHVGAATAAEHERPDGQGPGLRGGLLLQALLHDHGRLGVGQLDPRRCRHRLAPNPPGTRHAHEPGGELTAAAVALVLTVERHGGEGATAGQRARRTLTRPAPRYRRGGLLASPPARRAPRRRSVRPAQPSGRSSLRQTSARQRIRIPARS